jgi:catechol 2,3-dioxygenase-like lactoylglutathione lyase family enzyme
MPIRGVSELTLEVVDLSRSVQFYTQALGLPVVERWEHRGVVWLMAGERTRIGLWEPQVGLAGGRGGIHVHYALYIDEVSFDEAVERLRRFGHDVEIDQDRGRAAYVSDPDGNVVELWTWDVAQHLSS